jgi:hypothetical protein
VIAVDPHMPTPRKKGPKHAGTKGAAVGANGSALFTRQQAAAFLGVSLGSIRRWAAEGKLEPAKRRSGVNLYTREQLEEHAVRIGKGRGELAAQAFSMLEAGRTPVEIVIELAAPPAEIYEIVQAYAKLSQSWIVAGPEGPRDVWEITYGLGRLTPTLLRRALELCAAHEPLRKKLLEG